MIVKVLTVKSDIPSLKIQKVCSTELPTVKTPKACPVESGQVFVPSIISYPLPSNRISDCVNPTIGSNNIKAIFIILIKF